MATASARPLVQDGFECREMNDAEFAQYEIDQEKAAQAILDAEAKTKEKQAILKRLGLTSEELNALLS